MPIWIWRSVYGEFCQRFAARTATLTVGPGLNDPQIGPLMNEKAVAKQEAHVADALAKGGKLLTGASQHEAGPRFYQPAVINNVAPMHWSCRKKSLAPLLRFRPSTPRKRRSPARMTTEYGLVAYIHTQDPHRIYRASRALQYGMVATNRTKVAGAPIQFGGRKQSGLDREGARLGITTFMEVKYVCRDWAWNNDSKKVPIYDQK